MSPIRGLTDQGAAFPHLGELRKGAPKNGNAPGKDLEFFRFTSSDPDMVLAFASGYGDRPAELEVRFPYRTWEENLQAWQEAWGAGSLKHRCDGQTCVLWQERGIYHREPKPCPGGCRPVGRLTVLLPGLRRLALVTVLTTSIWDILTLSENLQAAAMLRGDLRGIPFVLRRKARQISVPKSDGTRTRREASLLSIEPSPRWVVHQIAAEERAALPPGAPLEVPADVGEADEADEAEIGSEPELETVPANPGVDLGPPRADPDSARADWQNLEDLVRARDLPLPPKPKTMTEYASRRAEVARALAEYEQSRAALF